MRNFNPVLVTLLALTSIFADKVFTTLDGNTSLPIVETPLGKIQGSTLESRLGREIYAFRGIRYAQAPVKELRFKPPVPVTKWKNIYNATVDGPLCPQPTNDPTSEDCLILNVYTTELPSTKSSKTKRPVIVYLHAGGFYSVGSTSRWAGPRYWMDQDVVLVTMNYRLGTLGFLATGTKDAPGNNGLKDQVEGLRWIQRNIEAFGGDKDNVQLMGYSAGGMSVILHLVSPMSKGLFHKAVAMSGSSTSQWPIKDEQVYLARRQASLVGCNENTTNVSSIVNCLRNVSASTLGNSLDNMFEFLYDPVLIWLPVIEKDFGQERFLIENPIKSILNNNFQKVPFITGIMELEFAYKAFAVFENSTALTAENNKWDEIAPISHLYERNTSFSKRVSNGLKDFYFQNKSVDNSTFNDLAELYADSVISFGANRAIKLISERNTEKSYYYQFAFHGRYSHFYLPDTNDTVPYGAVHHDDLIYLFDIPEIFPFFNKSKEYSRERTIVDKMTSLYANFAIHGNPVPEINKKFDSVTWEPYDKITQKYLYIADHFEIRSKMNEERYKEWEKLFPLSLYH